MLVDLVPIHVASHRDLVERLQEGLRRRFAAEVRARRPWFDAEQAYDVTRGQYNSSLLLKLLLTDPDDGADRVLGVTAVDLFVPVLTYVFGEAQLDGRAAMVSLHRLRPEVYGLPPDDRRLFARLEIETVHELGHTFGLLHCQAATCVMHASTYVEEIDLKTSRFCESCLQRLASGDRTPRPGT